ncbi:MAG: outer membrane beta-barrel protein, partial [Gammaproteobacteria bacterium]|nr:outer membrane beta-barrel protein [Gammaproteobacteria bacterium]
MMSKTSRWLVVFSMVVAGIVYGPAQAKEPETVINRDRPEVDALGRLVGSFWLFPALGVETYHNDNIFASNSREESDFITRIKPELDLESNWNRHMLNLTANADIGRYSQNDGENFEDYGISIDGRLDVQGEDTLTGKAGYARKHVRRDSPNDQNGKEPTLYEVSSASTAYRKKFNRLSFRVGAEFERRDYNDVKSQFGKKINNDDQDRDELGGLVQINYDILPQYSVFLRTRYKTIDYDDTFDSRGLQRSSDGYKIVVGTELRVTGLLYGEVFAGYGKRDYDDSTLKNIDEPTGGVSLTWLPSQLTTV